MFLSSDTSDRLKKLEKENRVLKMRLAVLENREPRNVQIGFNVSRAEKDYIQAEAKRAKMTVSKFLRTKAISA